MATAVTAGETRYVLLDQLRAVGALCVVWSHLVGNWLTDNDHPWLPLQTVRSLISGPAELRNDLGSFGVALFFFVSGFVITHASYRETGRQFLLRRMLRIYPPLLFAVAVTMLLAGVGLIAGGELGIGSWISVATLANWVMAPPVEVLPVTWTLFIELAFYLLVWATRPLARRAPLATPGIVLAVAVIATVGASTWSGDLALASRWIVMLPVLALGQLVYLAATRRVSVPIVALVGGIGAVILVAGLQASRPTTELGGDSWVPSIVIAGLIFGLALALEARASGSRILGVVARRSYSLYLLHYPVGMATIGILTASGIPYTASLLVALVLVAGVTEAGYRLVERPWIAISRRLA